MAKFLKRFLLVVLVLFVLVQFVPHPKKNNSNSMSVTDIHQKYTVPSVVEDVLKTSCYDCHSNDTRYPWYFNIQPVAWWLGEHIADGKKHLNFSTFLSYPLRKQYKKLEEIAEQVEEDEMPLTSYTLIHRDAVLDGAQKNLVINWAKDVRNSMSTEFPIDSLMKKN